MRVVDITHFYNRKSGGVKSYLLSKAEFFSKYRDINHTIVVPGEENKRERIYNTEIYYIKSPEVFFWKPYRIIRSKKDVLEILRLVKPDIVEVGSPFFLPKIVNEFKPNIGYKSIGFFHSNLETSFYSVFRHRFKNNFIKTVLRKYTYNNYKDFDLILSPSEFTKRYINNVGLENVKVVRIGVDTNIFKPEDKKNSKLDLNLPVDKIVLLYVGRFSKDKSIHELLDIFNTIDYLYRDRFFLHLVGGGPEERKLEKYIHSKNYRITPYINDKNLLRKIYNSADLFISTSRSDTYGISILESQACGTPVLVYSKTSFSEITYYTELISENKYMMIKKLTEFEPSKYSPSELSNFIKENFSLESCFENLLKIYYESQEF
ncbi:MAG: glycosyltransferase [Hydrogenothermaceae bacterium]|nr:glycosyltransferase [Hydrogenothermaceae bacterium]